MSKEKYLDKAINWARSKGFNSIRANHEEFEAPSSYTLQRNGDTYIPDVTGIKRTRKHYIEVAVKEPEKVARKASKWKLLSTLANRKGGELILLAPHGHKAFAQRIIDKYHLNSRLVSI